MLISDLYEALDELNERTTSIAEIFAEDGDLAALNGRLNDLGSRAYSMVAGVSKINSALSFEE